MHLTQRGRGQWALLEIWQRLLPAARPARPRPMARTPGEILRGHLVLQPGQLGHDLGRQDIKARGEELPHLDHHPAHAHSQGAKARGDAAQPVGSRLFHAPAQAHSRQQPLPPEQLDDHAREKEEDAAIACAEDAASRRGGRRGRPDGPAGSSWHCQHSISDSSLSHRFWRGPLLIRSTARRLIHIQRR